MIRAALVCLAVSSTAVAARAQDAFVNWETPHVSPLALTPSRARLLAVNTPDDRLEVFDLASGVPVHALSITVGLDPVSVRARTSTEAWVVNHVSDSVSIVDLAQGNVVATLATDDEPCDVVFAGTPERAFVSCSQANTVLVFDPLALATAPARIPIRGEDPRAMAVGISGQQVFVAIFESGNGTTMLSGADFRSAHFPPDVVSVPTGPYGGQNPPPNSGDAFDPPIADGLPPPPLAGLIVRFDGDGRWFDDNGRDWTDFVSGPQAGLSGRPVGWTLLDHDVAIIDTSSLEVTYASGLMNIDMAIAVRPLTGAVTVVGTEATNEVRYEPNLTGTFVRAHLARFPPDQPDQSQVSDLNSHLDYTEPTVSEDERREAIGDPRGLAWNTSGTSLYVTGMGSNNVVVLDSKGRRTTQGTIAVGEGPTGIVLDEPRDQAYVLAKFESAISVVGLAASVEIARVPFFDPSPSSIKRGRRHLYDTHETSGTGVVSCGSCHVDARMDRLAWELGNPAGEMKIVDTTQNIGNVPGLGQLANYQDWHPMKGPMLTQTLQDIIGKEPHHWRGDRDGLEEFNPAFAGLLGDDELLSTREMQEFEDFLATIHYPPNPYRRLDNSLPTNLPLPGHFTPGRFGSMDEPLPDGDAVAGLALYVPPSTLDAGVACVTCHTRPTGSSTDHRRVNGQFQPFPVGPSGEHHLALAASDGMGNLTRKVPQLRNLYERTGFDLSQPESTAGFGYVHDGSVDSLARFVAQPVFDVHSDQEVADLVAFLLAFGGDSRSMGSATSDDQAPGPPSQATHAAVGRQITLAGPPNEAELALLDQLTVLAESDAVGLVVKGRSGGLPRGWFYRRGAFQSDRKTEIATRAALVALAGPAAELTFTAVPNAAERRIGVDRDADGWFDRDELDLGTDPVDASSRPGIPVGPPIQPPQAFSQ